MSSNFEDFSPHLKKESVLTLFEKIRSTSAKKVETNNAKSKAGKTKAIKKGNTSVSAVLSKNQASKALKPNYKVGNLTKSQ